MAQKISQWLGVLAVITMMMTLVPLGSAAPAEAISGTNIRDQNVLRTTGISRVTYGAGGTLANDGATTTVTRETPETNSVAEIRIGGTQTSIGATPNWASQRASTNTQIPNTQIIRIRASFFKNNTNNNLPSGGATLIKFAYVVVRDRQTGEWADIQIGRGANGAWDNGPIVDDQLRTFCRNQNGGRRWTVNDGTGNMYDNTDSPPATVAGDKDTAEIRCGTSDRPFLSSVEFGGGNGIDPADVTSEGVSGSAGETLNVTVQFVLPTPEVNGPVDVYSAVEDDQQYADGITYYASVNVGQNPIVSAAPFTGVGSTTATANNNTAIFVSVEDRDSEADVKAVIAMLVAPGGQYVQLIFYHRVDLNFGTPGTPGQGTSISVTDFQDRYQVYDSATNRYFPIKPTDTGTIRTTLGTLDINSSSFTTSGDRVTVTFQFAPSMNGAYQMFAEGVDRELNISCTVPTGSTACGFFGFPGFTVTGG